MISITIPDERYISLLERMMEISDAILVLYLKLNKLENNNQKGTTEYNKYLDYLTIAIEVEEDLYHSIDKTMLNNLVSIVKMKFPKDSIFFNRVLAKLKSNMTVFGTRKEGIVHEFNRIKQKMFNLLIIFFIQQYIDNEKDPTVKSKLIMIRNSIICKNPEIEFDLIGNLFNIKDVIYDISPVLISCLCVNDDGYKTYVEEYLIPKYKENVYDSVIRVIKTILSNDDAYYNAPDGQFDLITQKCNLRACFLLIDEETIAKLNSVFHQMIDANDDGERTEASEIGKQAIIECFKEVTAYKDKRYVLQFPNQDAKH